MRTIAATAALLMSFPGIAASQDNSLVRVLSCKGPDASMEVFLPRSVVSGRGVENVRIKGTVVGQYVLDLSEIGKGKIAEQARISLSGDKLMVTVDQYARKLPPTRIPVSGGTVSFDNRFGTDAKCGPFNEG